MPFDPAGRPRSAIRRPTPLEVPATRCRPHPRAVFIRLGQRRPLQRQIYAQVRRAILDGAILPGARLPSSRTLADELHISRTTTLEAYEQLRAEGYLAMRHGSGTFVAPELPDDPPAYRPGAAVPLRRSAPLATRGAALAAIPPPARRIDGPPRPFRLGTPALDLLPVRLWSRLTHRRLASATRAQVEQHAAHEFVPPGLRELLLAAQRAADIHPFRMLIIVPAGAILSMPFIILARRLPPRRQQRAYALGLVVAALIYVAFAVAFGNREAIPLESGGVVFFGVAAVLGWRLWPVLLAIGWATHVAWDLWLPRPDPVYVPDCYPGLCVGFDLAVATAVLVPSIRPVSAHGSRVDCHRRRT